MTEVLTFTVEDTRNGDRWEDPLTGLPKTNYRWRVVVTFSAQVSAQLLERLKACMPTHQRTFRQQNGTWLGLAARYKKVQRTCNAGEMWLAGKRAVYFEFGDQALGEHHRNLLLRNITEVLVNLQSCPECGAAIVADDATASVIPPEMTAAVERVN